MSSLAQARRPIDRSVTQRLACAARGGTDLISRRSNMNYVRMRAFVHVVKALRGSVFLAIGVSRRLFALLIAQSVFLSAQPAYGADLPKPMSVVTLPGYEI